MNIKDLKIGESHKVQADETDDKTVKAIMDSLQKVDMLVGISGSDVVIKAVRKSVSEALKNLEHAFPKINPHGTNLYKR